MSERRYVEEKNLLSRGKSSWFVGLCLFFLFLLFACPVRQPRAAGKEDVVSKVRLENERREKIATKSVVMMQKIMGENRTEKKITKICKCKHEAGTQLQMVVFRRN